MFSDFLSQNGFTGKSERKNVIIRIVWTYFSVFWGEHSYDNIEKKRRGIGGGRGIFYAEEVEKGEQQSESEGLEKEKKMTKEC